MRAEAVRRRATARPGRPLPLAAAIVLAAGVAAADLGAVPPGEAPSPAAVGAARFPHDLHAGDLGFDCVDCHHETAAGRLEMPHEDYFDDFWIDCRSCHRDSDEAAAPQSCDECHHASPISTADETLSAKVVIHRSCWTCHDSGTGAEASRSCGFCHAGGLAAAGEKR